MNNTNQTMLEEYTADEIFNEIQSATSEDLSDILAAQKIREKPFKVFNND